jgi:hypothetical protein
MPDRPPYIAAVETLTFEMGDLRSTAINGFHVTLDKNQTWIIRGEATGAGLFDATFCKPSGNTQIPFDAGIGSITPQAPQRKISSSSTMRTFSCA